jgi:hypothetical protein
MAALLEQAGIDVWVFGGWAEELWQLAPPRPHNDIDLLYPAPDFGALDLWIAGTPGITEIRAKRFSHKRAVVYRDVMIEWILVEQDESGSLTRFFDGAHTIRWPDDTFARRLQAGGQSLRVASPAALQHYRREHPAVDAAYRALTR